MRLTLDEYSKNFKMSKEMIKSRLKAKRLNYIIENGITYIIVATKESNPTRIVQEQKSTKTLTRPIKKTTVSMVLSLYQKENAALKNKIIQLEAKIDKLIDDKEQMLRDERDKIEELYTKKDEQLKNILELVNNKMMMDRQKETVHEVEMQQKYILIELKDHLKSLDLKSHQRKMIKKRFLNAYDNDSRIIHKDGKLYLDFSKYDYGDLFRL